MSRWLPEPTNVLAVHADVIEAVSDNPVDLSPTVELVDLSVRRPDAVVAVVAD